MRRGVLVPVLIGIVALGVAFALSLLGGVRLLPSYLAAWLFCFGIPVGALAVLMALEIAGAAGAPLADPLRSTVAALPVLAVLAAPILLHPDALFPLHGSTSPFVLRALVFLVLWTLLSLVFQRRPARPGGPERNAWRGPGRNARRGLGRNAWRGPRRALAVVGLAVHSVIGTVAATDWALSLDPGLGSSSFGLLLMVSQCGAAVSVAVLLAAWNGRPWMAPSGLAALFLCLLGAWIFLEFTQFLIVWSANLSNEVAWYQRRAAGIGLVAERTAIGACAAALLLLLPRRFEVLTTSLAFAAGAVLFAHLIETFWLITPAFRDRLDVTGADLLVLCGLGALLVGASLLLGRWTEQRHGRA